MPESERMIGNQYAFKGDRATRWAFHKRANKACPPGPCANCGADKTIVHHIDENWKNNDISNLQRLCRACHAKHHGLPISGMDTRFGGKRSNSRHDNVNEQKEK